MHYRLVWGWILLVHALIVSAQEPSDLYLHATPYINHDHPRVQEALARVLGDAKDPTTKSERIFYFVRDDIAFGWTPRIYEMKASDVLTAGIGFSNTKATLFIALLRAAGIPARQHFYRIRDDVIRGFIARPNNHLDHSYTEVYLNDKWIKTDAYIVDRPLYLAAHKKLTAERRPHGYGIRLDGSINWHVDRASFIQFYGPDSPFVTHDHGIYADVGDFYARQRGNDRIPKYGPRLIIRQYIQGVQRRVAAVRAGK